MTDRLSKHRTGCQAKQVVWFKGTAAGEGWRIMHQARCQHSVVSGGERRSFTAAKILYESGNVAPFTSVQCRIGVMRHRGMHEYLGG